MKYDFKKFMLKNVGFLLVAIVSALYIVKGLYTLGKKYLKKLLTNQKGGVIIL